MQSVMTQGCSGGRRMHLKGPLIGLQVSSLRAQGLEGAVHVLQVADHGIHPVVIH